jgi:hypothetical protein
MNDVSAIQALHRNAMDRTDVALLAQRRGDAAEALLQFREAFELERRAARSLADDYDAEPSRSVLLRSAASLALDAQLTSEAEKLACTALAGNPPAEIAEELRDLLEQIHFQRHLELRGITLEQEEMQLSIAGQDVGFGIAPTETFLERVEHTQKLLQPGTLHDGAARCKLRSHFQDREAA